MARGFQLIFRAAEGPVVREFDRDRIVLGRSMVCDAAFDSPHLSRKHAEIVRNADGWSIRDLNSRNGIAVNGQKVLDHRLSDGELIALAPDAAEPTLIEFRLAAVPHAAPAIDLGSESHGPNILASIDLPQLAASLSKSGEHPIAAAASPAIRFDGAPQLSTLGLFKSAGEILLANDNLDDMLARMANLVAEHLPGRRVALCMPDASAGELVPRCFNGQRSSGSSQGNEATHGFHVSRSILQEAARVRRALLVASAAEDPRFQTAASIRQQSIRSAACVPLYHDGRIEGAIYVDSQSGAGALGSADLEVLTVLGLLLATGITQLSLRGDVARERSIRARLARYNSPQVVEEIMRRVPRAGQHEPSLICPGAQEDAMLADEYEVSVLFADLGGFTALAERWPAAEVVRVLNLIFERWTADVFARDGTLDKYIGDAVMAVFGAPLRQPDHAVRAVVTAKAMQRSLDEFNRTQNLEQALTVRIGINSGRAIAGDIGSPQHRGYTVIGDVVNIASRLETSVAQSGEIVIGQATYDEIREFFACESLGERPLRGKRQAVHAYRLV